MNNLNIKTLKYGLLDREVFLLVEDINKESFDILFEAMNQRKDFVECKRLFVEDYLSKNDKGVADYDFIIKNWLGLEDTMKNIEEYYRVATRDVKIDDLIKD